MSQSESNSAALSPSAEQAYERVLPEAQALDAEALSIINIDVPASIITGMSVAERLPTYADQLKALHDFPAKCVDNFSDYVLALFIAQSRYAFATNPVEELPTLNSQAAARRDVFIADGKALVARGHLSSDALDVLTGTHGYKNVAFDLSGLAQLYKAAWPKIQGNTGLKLSEIEAAGELALRLAAAVAHRDNKETIAEVTSNRHRMFTLFVTSYDQLRRGMSYVRWNEGDVDEIIPSLYAGRQNSNIVKKATSDAKTSSANNGQTPAATPAAPAATNSATATAGADKVPVGFPGSDPLSKA